MIFTPKLFVEQAAAQIVIPHQEHCFACAISPNGHMIGEAWLVGIGTGDQVLVYPREVFRQAVIRSASSVAVAHNHISDGPLVPSESDVANAWQLKRAGNALQIFLRDDILFRGTDFVSLRELGEL